MKRTSTYVAKPGDTPERWRVMDAQGQVLGRLARNIAIALQGNGKPTYSAHVPLGDSVVVTAGDTAYSSAAVLIAAGPWSAGVADMAGAALPSIPSKGEIVRRGPPAGAQGPLQPPGPLSPLPHPCGIGLARAPSL